MAMKDRTYSILLISSSEKFNAGFSPFAAGPYFEPLCVCASASAAKRTLAERPFDIVIISSPLSDETGIQLAIDSAAGSSAAVLMFVRADRYSELLPEMTAQGVYLLSKQTSSQMIIQALDWLAATRERLRRFEVKEQTLADKMEEIRVVNRAKWVLISQQGFSEDEAHHFIEKQAMNRCVTRRAVAEWILSTQKV